MQQDQAIKIYQSAVDPTMGPEQGTQWWQDVTVELDAVIAATDTDAAAAVIAWWHHDWRVVGQTPKRVARRIRRVASKIAPEIRGAASKAYPLSHTVVLEPASI